MMYLGRRCTNLLGSDQQKMFGEGSVVRALLSQHLCIIDDGVTYLLREGPIYGMPLNVVLMMTFPAVI